MITCPLEGTLIFSKCPVTTCMWYTGAGNCSHGRKCKDAADDSEPPKDLEETKTNILHYVTVGKFLESVSGKELSNLTSQDFPKPTVFSKWCRSKSIKFYRDVPYEEIVEHVKREL